MLNWPITYDIMAKLLVLFISWHVLAQTTLLWGAARVLGGQLTLIIFTMLMTTTTSLKNFGNLNKVSTTHFCNPPNKMFSRKLVHLRCSIHLGINMAHIGLNILHVLCLHQIHYSMQLLVIWHELLNKELQETNPSQACHHLVCFVKLSDPQL